MKNFLTWFDPEIHEVLSVEKSEAPKALIDQLKKENIKIVEIPAQSVVEANGYFLEFYEHLFPQNTPSSTASKLN